jgi:hypothetical protein
MKRMASARKNSRRSAISTSERRFVVCVRNSGYAASLEQNKIYVAIPDQDAERHGQVRVIDESGEDYLYSANRFVAIEVPATLRASLLKAS